MAAVQAGILVARALKAHGVDTIFTLSGGHVMPIYEGCRLEGVRVLDVRHEQAAGHAAEAWGRINRACGVALATAGPGVTGTVTAVANCFAAQTPLVVLGGARPLVQAEQGALQEFDQLSVFKPITKWAATCTHADRAPAHDLFFQHSRGAALEAADVVCVVGTPLDFRLKFGRFGDAKLVHVHGDARELGRNRAPDAGIVGDCAAVLGILADGVKTRRPDDAWLERLRAAEAAWWNATRTQLDSESAPLHHYRLGKILDEVLDPGTIVIGDGGDVVAAVSRVLRVHRPGHWLDPGPFGCLGVGPPYALGVKAAKPDKQVVVVAGDGAFGLNGFELDTLVRFGLLAVFVIGNDAGWVEIRIPQKGIYGDDAAVAVDPAPTR